jgi:thymidylate synthase (FAD)
LKLANIEVKYIDHMGTDLSVVNAARTSFDKASEWDWHEDAKLSDPETGYIHHVPVLSHADTKLINYLAKYKHKSPFNHTFISLHIKAPIYVARQLVKHKFMPWNEVSRRYVDSEPEFYIPEIYRQAAENVKQGSSSEDSGYDRHTAIEHSWMCLDEYNARLAHGVCAEQARECLPLNTHTEWYWSGTLGAFADMLILRLDNHTQYETRLVAEQARDIILPLFPVSLKALLEHK